MRYLLDTHTLIWFLDDSPKLSDDVAQIIESPKLRKYISVASLWEFVIKYSLKKLDFDGGVKAFRAMALRNGIQELPIIEAYLHVLEALPFLHKDPFDRLIVASAIVEDMTILTADDNIHQYEVKCQW